MQIRREYVTTTLVLVCKKVAHSTVNTTRLLALTECLGRLGDGGPKTVVTGDTPRVNRYEVEHNPCWRSDVSTASCNMCSVNLDNAL